MRRRLMLYLFHNEVHPFASNLSKPHKITPNKTGLACGQAGYVPAPRHDRHEGETNPAQQQLEGSSFRLRRKNI